MDLLRRRLFQQGAAPGTLVRARLPSGAAHHRPLGGKRETRPVAAADRRRRSAWPSARGAHRHQGQSDLAAIAGLAANQWLAASWPEAMATAFISKEKFACERFF